MLKIINNMVRVDQEARILGSSLKQSSLFEPIRRLVRDIDNEHNYHLKEIINQYGYPTKKSLGKSGLKKFWLLIQHQDLDPKLQKECLKKCNFEGQEYAHLYDRVRVNAGKIQTYGTQLNKPIGEISEVDAKRKELGLKSLKSNLKDINKKVPPGQAKLKIEVGKDGKAFYSSKDRVSQL